MDELYHHTVAMITQGTRMIANAPCKSSPDCCYHRLTMYTDDADLDVVDSNVSVGNTVLMTCPLTQSECCKDIIGFLLISIFLFRLHSTNQRNVEILID